VQTERDSNANQIYGRTMSQAKRTHPDQDPIEGGRVVAFPRKHDFGETERSSVGALATGPLEDTAATDVSDRDGAVKADDGQGIEGSDMSRPGAGAEAPDPAARAREIFETRTTRTPNLRTGACLRQAREAHGLSLADLANELCIRESYLAAIERMEIKPLPRHYPVMFVRSYAGRMGLPTEDVVEAYTAECGALDEVRKPEPVVARAEGLPRKTVGGRLALAFAGTILAGIGVMAALTSGPTQPKPVVTAAPEPVNGARDSLFAKTAPPTGTAPERLPLALVAKHDAWLEVRGADGTIFRSRRMAAGEVYHPRIGAGWTVSARDGGAFEWRVGDAAVGMLGPEGGAVYAASIDQVAREASDSAAPALAATGGGEPSR